PVLRATAVADALAALVGGEHVERAVLGIDEDGAERRLLDLDLRGAASGRGVRGCARRANSRKHGNGCPNAEVTDHEARCAYAFHGYLLKIDSTLFYGRHRTSGFSTCGLDARPNPQRPCSRSADHRTASRTPDRARERGRGRGKPKCAQ